MLRTLLALAMAIAPVLTALAAERWPTTRFEVFVGVPFIDNTVGGGIAGNLLGPETLDDAYEDNLPHPSAIAEMEKALHEAAVWYKDKGLPPPALDTLIETDEGEVYRVYLCQWRGQGFRCGYNPSTNPPTTSSGKYLPKCANDPTRSELLYLNIDRTISGMGLTEGGYQTLAHELMHAITANTKFGKQESNHCGSVNRWITEGIPDAIGYDVMEDLWKGKFAENTGPNSVNKRHGYRPYSVSLPQDDNVSIPTAKTGVAQGHYGTSSFWRYVANSSPTGWKNLLTKGSGTSAGLYDTALTSTSKNWRKEVQWADAWLHKRFNQRLRDMYGNFVNNFAYRLAPLEHYKGRPVEDNLEHWAGILFDECEQVRLSPGGSQTFTLMIQQLAARCVWVETPGTKGLVHVSFQAGSDNRELLDSITIGMAGTLLVSRANPIADITYGPTPHLASWRDYPQNGSEKTLYIVSNVARVPRDSVNRQVTFTASIPNNKNSARSEGSLPASKVAKRPMKPSYDRKAKSLARQKSATQKMVQEQINLDKETLNPNVSGSTHAARRPNGPNCNEPFKYSVCGAYMSITLSVHPGNYLSLSHTSSQGGAAGQMMGSLSAMAQTSAYDSQERALHLAGLLKGIDGHHVSISVPMFDYGQTPSFSNAAITVGMANEKSYSAIGPADQSGFSPLIGRVSITEYTPYAIKGTFSAALAEYVAGAGPNDPPVYQSRGNVSGTFTSVAPWLGDERITIVHDSHEQMADDIMNSLGVPAGMAQSMREDGSLPPSMGGTSGGGGGSGGGGAVGPPECTCECEIKDLVDELCEMLCEEEFAACE